VCMFFVLVLVRAKPWRLNSRKYVFERDAPKNKKVYGYKKNEARKKLCISSKEELHDLYR
jgi:hypothetical protein